MFGRRARILWLAAALSLPTAPELRAQERAEYWASALELGFTGASGNNSFSILTAAASLDRLQRDRFELQMSGRIRYGDGNGEVVANDMQANVTFDWSPEGTWSPFVFATVARDVIRNLDGRAVAGAGMKWTFWRPRDVTKLSLSGAAIYDYDNYRPQADVEGPGSRGLARASWRVKFDHEFGSGTTVQHVTFWQPRLGDFGDYIVDVANSVETTLVSQLSLVMTHSFIRESLPPPGAVPNDQRVGVTLRVRF